MDPYHDIQQQLFDALDEGDNLRQCVSHVEEVDDEDDNLPEPVEAVDDLYEQATCPMYRGTNISVELLEAWNYCPRFF